VTVPAEFEEPTPVKDIATEEALLVKTTLAPADRDPNMSDPISAL
jgi:hypothetical protein